MNAERTEAMLVWGQSLQRFRVAGEVNLGLRQELLCFGSQLAGAKIVLLLEVLSALPERCYGVYDRPEDPLDWDQEALSHSGEMTIAGAPRDIGNYFLVRRLAGSARWNSLRAQSMEEDAQLQTRSPWREVCGPTASVLRARCRRYRSHLGSL